MFADTITFSDANTLGETSFCSTLHTHGLWCTEESDWVVVDAPKDEDQRKTLLYLYFSNTSDEVLKTLSDFYTSGFYAWDSRAKRASSALSSS